MTNGASNTEQDVEDASIVAAQEAFLSSGSRPAAKVIRTTNKPQPPPTKSDSADEYVRHGPEWYQQMKGVRFRLDDLEDDDTVLPPKREKETRTDRKPVNTDLLGSAVMGDIVERKTSTARPVFVASGPKMSTTGFPEPRKLGRLQSRSQVASSPSTLDSPATSTNQPEGKALMEEIDRENRLKLAQMSEEEILQLQKSLQESLPTSLREKLLSKTDTKSDPETADSELVESSNPSKGEKPPKSANKPSNRLPTDDSLNDQSFDAHLRTFFPPTTTSIAQPEWTLPIHPAEETFYAVPDKSSPQATSMRFDFNGKFIPSDTSRSLPTHLGLHHHSLDPGAAGYTLSELSILARSIQPSQKCIALKIIGFVLADVASGKYTWDITEGLWDEIDRERIIEILLNIAKGGKDSGGNRSVQRYAEDAVSRWVNVGGPQLWEERLQKKGFEKVDVTE